MATDDMEWQQKLDQYLARKLIDPTGPNRKRWGERSQEYLQTHTNWIIEVLRDEFGALTDLRVLDLGCGNGLDAINLARSGAFVTGVEVVPDLIEIARLRARNEQIDVKFSDLNQRDGWDYPQYYDAVIVIDVLEHIEKPIQVIETCYRVLRPGGIVIFTTPNRWAVQNILADPHWRLFGVTLLPRWLSQFYIVSIRHVLREYDMTEFVGLPALRRLLDAQGLARVEDSVTETQAKWVTPMRIGKSWKRRVANIFSTLAKTKLFNFLMTWIYCYLFVGTWRVVARKPVA